MLRVFSSLLILSCLCTCANHLSFIKADDDGTLCDATTQSGLCANLGNISYPFGVSAPCAASDSLRLNCSNSSQAYWDAFTPALDGDEAKLGAPALDGIFTAGHLTFVNLTWNLGFYKDAEACGQPLLASTVNDYLPEVIDLNGFANDSFLLSAYNHILLLNCTSLPSSILQQKNTVCQAYQQQCGHSLINPCTEIAVPTKQLKLHENLTSLSCTHFQFFVATETVSSISTWSPGLIQLFYGDAKCLACFVSNGACIYSQTAIRTYQGCACPNGNYSDTDCDQIQNKDEHQGCKGFYCKTIHRLIVGVVAAVTVTAALTIIGMVIRNRRKRTRSFSTETSGFINSHFDFDGLTERPTPYPYASIALATNKFRQKLGEGGFGAVYKGILGDGTGDTNVQIAVKVLEARSKQSKKHFLSEVGTIGRIHHVHVVRLLGFCIEGHYEMLVYEFVVNGSLDTWLFQQSGSQNRVLCWEERYAIAIGIARGLGYLHEECRHQIVHCDIKPQNILLDAQMCPKIADFGLARLMGREESRVATLARGTPGYMGPEFWMGGESQLSTKFDVYSYGMVLLELISGQRNFSPNVRFPYMAYEAAMSGKFESILDVKLGIAKASDGECAIMADGMQRQQVRTAVFVALWCIQDDPTNRPSMKQVVQYLEGVASVDEQPPRPAITSIKVSKSAQQPLQYLSSGAHHTMTPISRGR